MRDPHVHPIRITLIATAAAGMMLVVIAGCSDQALNTREGDASAGGVMRARGGARTGVVVVSADAGGGTDGAAEAGTGHTHRLWNSDNPSAAINHFKSLGVSLPQRYLAF
jgi:hypothetical protein